MSRKGARRVTVRLPRDLLSAKQVTAYAKRSDGTSERIRASAKALVDDGSWPSAERIRGDTGLAIPTIRRHRQVIDKEKARFVELHGPSRYWNEPTLLAVSETTTSLIADQTQPQCSDEATSQLEPDSLPVGDAKPDTDIDGTNLEKPISEAGAELLLLVRRLRDELDRSRKARAGLRDDLADAREQIVRLEAALDAKSKR